MTRGIHSSGIHSKGTTMNNAFVVGESYSNDESETASPSGMRVA